jgi:hypothetical protein
MEKETSTEKGMREIARQSLQYTSDKDRIIKIAWARGFLEGIAYQRKRGDNHGRIADRKKPGVR